MTTYYTKMSSTMWQNKNKWVLLQQVVVLLKQAGDRSGKPPEAGPTPQGLDFLMKRGR